MQHDKNDETCRVCFVSTIMWPLKVFMVPHILRVSKYAEVTLVSSDAESFGLSRLGVNARLKNIEIARAINVASDFIALFKLISFFRLHRFQCVHSMTPKAGLLAMIAATVARVPVRIHTFTGQVWVTRKGPFRYFLKCLDVAIGFMATNLLVDSPSQRDFLIANHVVKKEKVNVLGIGSIVGVDIERFSPDDAARSRVRAELGIDLSEFVYIYVGRLNQEKGIDDLLNAFNSVLSVYSDVHLLLVGPDEGGFDDHISSLSQGCGLKVHRVKFTDSPECYMAAADVICLPSYREGFGSVLIEAAAVGMPAIATSIYGVTDAVVSGVTGVLYEPGKVSGLTLLMSQMRRDGVVRMRMGTAAQLRVRESFSQQNLVDAFDKYYRDLGIYKV